MSIDSISLRQPAELQPQEEQRINAALAMLKQGSPKEKIVHRTGFSLAQLEMLEQKYYDSRTELDERAMRIKQMDRLDALLEAAWALVDPEYLRDDKGNFGANLSALVTLLREISELAGLKKKQVQTEVRVIEESQTEAVVAFVSAVAQMMMSRMEPLLTKAGQRQLDKSRDQWLTQAVADNVRLIEGTIEV